MNRTTGETQWECPWEMPSFEILDETGRVVHVDRIGNDADDSTINGNAIQKLSSLK